MHVRDLTPRLFNHAILRMSSFCMREREDFQGRKILANLGVGIAKICVFPCNSSGWAASLHVFKDTGSHCADARLLQFLKKAVDGHSVQVDLQKRFVSSVQFCTQPNLLSRPWNRVPSLRVKL